MVPRWLPTNGDPHGAAAIHRVQGGAAGFTCAIQTPARMYRGVSQSALLKEALYGKGAAPVACALRVVP